MKFLRFALLAWMVAWWSAAPARAVIIFGPGNEANTSRNLGSDPNNLNRFLGQFTDGSSAGFVGTAIAPTYFVTANHVGNTSTLFNLGSTTYNVAFVANQNDLAVWRIATPDVFFPEYAPLYTAQNEVGRPVTLFGSGYGRGNPVTGGWQWDTTTYDRQVSWGTNQVAGIVNGDAFPFGGFGGSHLYFTFDAGQEATEGIVASGDSGGAVFVLDPNDNVWKLAGVNSLVDTVDAPSVALFDAFGYTYTDGTGPHTINVHVAEGTYATRISTRLDFLGQFAPVPEPSTVVLMGMAAVGSVVYRWRRYASSRPRSTS